MSTHRTKSFSTLFTTEPQITRALAAEIRHAPDTVEKYFKQLLGMSLGQLSDVACEKAARVDVLLTFTGSNGPVRVAIEAKVDHVLSDDQIERESGVSDFLVLLVLAHDDAAAYRDQVAAVITWAELLAIFLEPRLRLSDIESIPAQKVQVERILRRTLKNLDMPKGWTLDIVRGGAAMPGITILSPVHPIGGQLCGQIQVRGRSMPAHLNDVQLEYYAGTRVEETDENYPLPSSNTVPRWVTNARILYSKVLDGDPSTFDLKTRAPGSSRKPLGDRRKELTTKYLSESPWLAQGYVDWSLGVRAQSKPIAQVETLASDALRLFTAWFDALDE